MNWAVPLRDGKPHIWLHKGVWYCSPICGRGFRKSPVVPFEGVTGMGRTKGQAWRSWAQRMCNV